MTHTFKYMEGTRKYHWCGGWVRVVIDNYDGCGEVLNFMELMVL